MLIINHTTAPATNSTHHNGGCVFDNTTLEYNFSADVFENHTVSIRLWRNNGSMEDLLWCRQIHQITLDNIHHTITRNDDPEITTPTAIDLSHMQELYNVIIGESLQS